MEDQYSMADLRHYNVNIERPLFQPVSSTQRYDQLLKVSPQGLHNHTDHQLHSEFRAGGIHVAADFTGGGAGGFKMEAEGFHGGDGGGGGGDGGTIRWPRQETLTLLEIRSRLDSKFKEANQKGPVWDEVSRIMSEEHGYHRSGKKCREKFENLYKYYKKTKDGKAGRQDGKHYRFFRQLEALYGETSNAASVQESHLVGSSFGYNASNIASHLEHYPGWKVSDTSLSLSNPSDFDATSSEDNGLNEGSDERNKRKGRSRRWKSKMKDFIDAQMKKLMDKQDAWMEKMMRTIEQKEHERVLREQEWRKQQEARIEREHKFWANERAWIEAREAALMDALNKLSGKESRAWPADEQVAADIRSLSENHNDDGSETITNTGKGDIWPESEITRLIELRACMEERFQQSGVSEEVIWEEIAAKMACCGYERSPLICKEKWDSVNGYLLKANKKRREDHPNYQVNESVCSQGIKVFCDSNEQPNDTRTSLNSGNAVNDNSFRFFMGDADTIWENYALKINKG